MTLVSWHEHGTEHTARWHSENGSPPPVRVEPADDSLTANAALRRIRAGTALLWQGDYHGARQLLKAVGRRADHRALPHRLSIASEFRAHRAERAEHAGVLGGIVVLLEPGHHLSLRRAPDVTAACQEAYGDLTEPTLISLTELQGVISAWQWHQRGVPVPALGALIHPRYGVFSPTRSEYVDLVARAPLPTSGAGTQAGGTGTPADGAGLRAMDIGTGTGVLAAVLARRGIPHVTATDLNPRAVACARENIERLGLTKQVTVQQADLFPEGRADLVVCNPPWLPGDPSSALELGIYDAESGMLSGFLAQLPDHLTPAGEGWLVLSDLAEHLHLRSRDQLLTMIAAAGLTAVAIDATPARHSRAEDPHDRLHEARRKEITTLWRLRVTPSVR
ncbi:MAG: hypothetical protein DI611_13215 [Brachybacterium faecium]|nr:MAG: hypothetical protein DI611_13215 [Brachybacterium faecium]